MEYKNKICLNICVFLFILFIACIICILLYDNQRETFINNNTYDINNTDTGNTDTGNTYATYDTTENIDTKKPNKIAFLFLTYNNIKRPDIWNNFLDINSDKYINKFTLYNHAKEPTKVSDILKGTQIKEYIDTCWGCFGSVEANILMMKEALKDPLNKKFILMSETCVPVVSFDKLYNEIMKDDKSRINVKFYNNTVDRYDAIIDPPLKKDEFCKHSGQGLLFNRKHATLLVNSLDKFKNKWKDMVCVDEHYFGNILKVLDQDFNNNNNSNGCTFDLWNKYILNSNKINKDDMVTDAYVNIKKLSNTAIDEIRDKKFLLVRKISETTEIDVNYILD